MAATTRRAIQARRLVRPDGCSHCQRTGVAIDAVHEDYADPLRVTWLCKRCHHQWSLARRREQGARP